MKIQIPTVVSGRFQLIKHTGHVFDGQGKVVQYGDVVEATPFSPNAFTPRGMLFINSVGPNSVSMGVSTSAGVINLASPGGPIRTSSSLVSVTHDRRTLADDDGRAWWRKTYRFTFPATPGLTTVTLQRAMAIFTGGPVAGGTTSATGSVAQLIGAAGQEAGVTVNMATEDFDVVWEFTEYVPLLTEGTLVAVVRDGLGNVMGSTSHDYLLRPANIDNIDVDGKGWQVVPGAAFPSLSTDQTAVSIGTGTVANELEQPTFSDEHSAVAVTTPEPLGSGRNTITAEFGFDETTATETYNCARVLLGHTDWQITFTPPIPKTSHQLFNLLFTLTASNKA